MSQELALAAMSASLVLPRQHNKNKKPKRWWVRQLLVGGHRHGLDLLDTLKLDDGSGFRNFTSMTPTDFECRVKVFSQFKSIFRRPHGENSERTDAMAVAMPPNTSTLEMLRNIVSMNPTPDGTRGTRF
jgi:hypothetical protein